MELEKKYIIQDNFIGIFDNFFPKRTINSLLEYYNNAEKNFLTFGRDDKEKVDDNTVSLQSFQQNPIPLRYNTQEFIEVFYKDIFKLFEQKFVHLKNTGQHSIFDVKIQKTLPSQGYHAWHTEVLHRRDSLRFLTFILYLNDVEEGGETEFLYQQTRIKPVENRFVLWPAGMTHIHRGNPPLKGEKYILTGWVEWI
jgi:hypothetical protein